ncbi:MAG: asparagine--tRNA ligase [Candidatus Absconditabacterales bacterium]
MMQTTIKHITADLVGQSITLQGWIQTIRSSGKIVFLELRDGTGYIQCIAELSVLGEDIFRELESCGIETSLSIAGTVSKHPKKDEYEIQVSDYHIYTKTNDYPLGTKDDHGPEFLFDKRHLYLRSKTQVAIQRIRDTIIHATYDWMRDNEFIKIDAPIFTPNAAEGTTELYEVEHVNGEKMYLSQTGQLYIEAALMGHRNIYDFGPVFRAEKSKTRRHLNEFWMMDAEMAFCDQEQNMKYQEELVYYILQKVLQKHQADLAILGRDTTPLQKIQVPFVRMTHDEWIDDLVAKGFPAQHGEDIGSDIEMQYMEKVEQPIFVTHFPIGIKAFYTKEDPNHPGYGLCADLLAPEGCGEVIGGSQRVDDYDTLLAKIKEHGLDPATFDRYLDLRKYGGVPHSGFGYGLERLVRWICGLHHIRETIPFPRYANRITP